jgi:hypothetical protein
VVFVAVVAERDNPTTVVAKVVGVLINTAAFKPEITRGKCKNEQKNNRKRKYEKFNVCFLEHSRFLLWVNSAFL